MMMSHDELAENGTSRCNFKSSIIRIGPWMSDLFEIIALFLNDKSYQGQLSDIDANFQGNLFETIQDYLHKLLFKFVQ